MKRVLSAHEALKSSQRERDIALGATIKTNSGFSRLFPSHLLTLHVTHWEDCVFFSFFNYVESEGNIFHTSQCCHCHAGGWWLTKLNLLCKWNCFFSLSAFIRLWFCLSHKIDIVCRRPQARFWIICIYRMMIRYVRYGEAKKKFETKTRNLTELPSLEIFMMFRVVFSPLFTYKHSTWDFKSDGRAKEESLLACSSLKWSLKRIVEIAHSSEHYLKWKSHWCRS